MDEGDAKPVVWKSLSSLINHFRYFPFLMVYTPKNVPSFFLITIFSAISYDTLEAERNSMVSSEQ